LAVSIHVPPSSTKRSSAANDVASSTRVPKFMAPSTTASGRVGCSLMVDSFIIGCR